MRSLAFAMVIFPAVCLAEFPFLSDRPRFGDVILAKATPVFYATVVPKGGIFYLETGSGMSDWTFNFGLKYFSGADSIEAVVPVGEYWKLEVQPRIYVIDLFSGIFFAPLIGIYSTGDLNGGAIFGYQHFFTGSFLVDSFMGIQTTAPVDNTEASLHLRFGINFGWMIK